MHGLRHPLARHLADNGCCCAIPVGWSYYEMTESGMLHAWQSMLPIQPLSPICASEAVFSQYRSMKRNDYSFADGIKSTTSTASMDATVANLA